MVRVDSCGRARSDGSAPHRAKPRQRSGTDACTSSGTSRTPGTSRCSCSAIITAASSTSATGTARRNGASRSWSRRRPPPCCPPISASASPTPRVAIGHELDYRGAGTVEFLVDLDRDEFSFLEINTRVQVEHPVTEMVTGVDIVREQLRIAAGEPLSFDQDDVAISGHAIECRINAESVADGFLPSPGTLTRWDPPSADHVRVDSHGFVGYEIPPYYDSLIAKLIVIGADRAEAIDRIAERARRLRDRGRRHDPRPSAGGVVARRLPKRHDQHPLARDDPPARAPAHRDCTRP